jgi:ABC-type nitrate/sulfonate/bicarbonate transport system permease component
MRSSGRLVLRIIPPLILLLLAAVVWELYARSGALGQDVLPPLSRVATAGWDDRASIWENTLPTLREVLIGFAVSLVFAFALSILLDASGLARRSLMPVLIGSQTIPLVVLAPLVVIWFGFGFTPKILLVALVTFFPIVVGLVDGYASSERDAITLMRTMGAGWFTVFRLVRLPSALPGFFTGLRIAITYAVVAAIFAEYAGAEFGLGVYIQGASNSFRTDLVLAAVLLSAVLTLALYAATFIVQRLVIPWYAESRRLES